MSRWSGWLGRTVSPVIFASLVMESVVLVIWWPFWVAPRTRLNFGRNEYQCLRGFSPDGKTICSYSDERPRNRKPFGLALWDADTGKLRAELKYAYGWHTFSPDGTMFAASQRQGTALVARVWDVKTGTVRLELGSVPDFFRGDFTPDGKWLVQVTDESATHGEDEYPFDSFSIHRYDLRGSRLQRAVVRVWDLGHGQVKHRFELSPGFCKVEFSTDGKVVIQMQGAERIRLWDVFTAAEIVDVRKKLSDAESREARMSTQNRIRTLQRLLHGQPYERDIIRAEWGGQISVFADGRRCSWVDWSEELHIHDLKTREELKTFPCEVSLPQIDPGGIGSSSLPIFVQRTTLGHAFTGASPDGSLIATEVTDRSLPLPDEPKAQYPREVKLWDVSTGKELLRLQGYVNPFFSPDGTILAVNQRGYGTIRLWDVVNQKWMEWPGEKPVLQCVIASALVTAICWFLSYRGLGRRRRDHMSGQDSQGILNPEVN